ncbi:MAG: hypothetical protein IGS16_11415 [Thermoleptolyngbya sp. C42_A2020_037]|nr:hypothetical protein [Thermoleptolyngbya sp. C42_A2020_037]
MAVWQLHRGAARETGNEWLKKPCRAIALHRPPPNLTLLICRSSQGASKVARGLEGDRCQLP